MVWMALECKGVEYVTVLVSKYNGDDGVVGEVVENVPRIVWPDDDGENDQATTTTKTDAIKLIEQIQTKYPSSPPQFYPKLSAAVDASRCNILRLPGVMPRNSDPAFQSFAPYLFREDGTLVAMSSHCVSLEEVEEMLEEYYLGPYLCGKEITAADMVWMPYLERYAVQLPLLYPKIDVLNPRSKSAYEMVYEWYLAMERDVPAYACCVQGDARHWRRHLESVVEIHNERAATEKDRVPKLPPIPKRKGWWLKKNPNSKVLWKAYYGDGSSRPWLGDTPEREVALYLVQNRKEIIEGAVEETSGMGMTVDETDEALREIIHTLIGSESPENDDENIDELSENASRVVEFVSERVEVPRDMGMIPALALGELLSKVSVVSKA